MSNTNEFKVGDKVRLKAERKVKHPEAWHGRMTVDEETPCGWSYVNVKTEEGKQGAFFPSELEADGFRVGDRVVVPKWKGSEKWGGELTIRKVWEDGACSCDNADGVLGLFLETEMKHVPAPKVEAEESEIEAQPVTYRICVGNTIGKTEYPSETTAREAALLHGKDGEEFSIWEVVKVADYRVKVTKSLETA